MGNILNVSDMHYYIQNPWDSSYDTYGVYKGAAGAFPQIPVGQKKRVAIPYCIGTNVSKVRIVIGSKYELFLKING